jgi:FlaA1/EpsC-like NDP-sugar epimerase
MRAAVSPRRVDLTSAELQKLSELTIQLIAARADAASEFKRFDAVRFRNTAVPESELTEWLAGKRVLVTGGTGCVGSMLLAALSRFGAGQLWSLSRRVTKGWPVLDQVTYLRGDVRDPASLARAVRSVRPDIVFHLAAQRDPGLAEREVVRTVHTNLIGTSNVVSACADAGVCDLICATSGKALRPYSRSVYTACKRTAEWVLASAAARTEMKVSASRFTHVVDNSIIGDRLRAWAASGVIRLHDPDAAFYVQSALESAQLMLNAGVRARTGRFEVSAIRDLGWPVSLLDLAVGTLQSHGSCTPIYFSGYDPGYERVAFPALYDPMTAGDFSPLLNGFEAASAERAPGLEIDLCALPFELGRVDSGILPRLEQACLGDDETAVRAGLDEISRQVFDAALAPLPAPLLRRTIALASQYEAELGEDHAYMLAGLRQHLASAVTADVS